MGDFSLTLDVIAGFPGEEESHFQNTVDLLRKVKPLKCHVFPYSQREGTRAAKFTEVPDALKRERAQKLTALGENLGRAERMTYVGQIVTVLVENRKKSATLLTGLTSNYLKVCFEGEGDWTGKIVRTELLSVQNDIFLGRSLSNSEIKRR